MRIRVLHGQSARPQPNAASSNASNAAFLAAGQGVEREFRARCSRIHIREHFPTPRGQARALDARERAAERGALVITHEVM